MILRILVAAAAFALAGCSAVEYYWQGFAGQVGVLAGARPVEEVLATNGDAKLAQRLQLAGELRAYASHELGLPDNATYTRYTDLGRPYVVWNVFAASPLALEPRQWCFPVVGCVSYRGYFSEADARAEAARLAGRGDDVHIGGVPAYSTLGWFDDPLMSSFIRYPDTALARLVFHELAHQVVYVRDDTMFNESFAAMVEEAGVERWIASRAGTPEHARLLTEQARSRRLQALFRRLVRDARVELKAVYAADLPEATRQARKAEVFGRMRAAYEAAKAGEVGLAGYDRWFAGYEGRGPNNASLAAVALYDDKVPGFRALLAEVNGDLPAFYARVRELSRLPKAERDARLHTMAAQHVAGTGRHAFGPAVR